MRRSDGHERIVVRVRQSNDRHHNHRNQHADFKHRGNFADQINSANVHISNHRNQRDRNNVVLPAHDARVVRRNVISEENRVGAAKQKRRRPVPPAREESPKIAVARAHPTVKSALYGHRRRQFRGDKRNGNAPEKWNQQVIEQRHSRAGRGDLLFEAERTARRIGKHHEYKREDARFFCGGF